MDHLVSLNWDHPLPSAIVALTLRPRALTVIAPLSAAQSAQQLRGVLEQHGIVVTLAFGADATDLDAGSIGDSMRAVIDRTLSPVDTVVLDYTGGSKLMAAAARLKLGGDGDSRAVYLDVSTGLLRWDDGREQPPSSILGVVELGALHGSTVLGTGGAPLSECPDAREVLADAPRILGGARTGVRRVFWKGVAQAAEAARREAAVDPPADRDGTAEEGKAVTQLRSITNDIVSGRAHMLPLMAGNEGDWLELVVADAVERALADAGADAVVRLNVEAHRDQRGRLDAEMPKQHPAVRALLLALRRVSSGEGTAQELNGAIDALMDAERSANVVASPDTDLEVDVVILRGHRVQALSCYGGTEDDRITWKSAEIARRVVQLGGDYARPGFVCLLDRANAEDLQLQLRWSAPGIPSVIVFGLDDLLDWTSTQPELGRLQQFLGLRAVPKPQHGAELPDDVDHDLLVTVGGTPLPILQSILAHRAKRPLLLHTTGTVTNAERISAALAGRGISSVRAEVADGFRTSSVSTVLDQLPLSAAVDITGGTKVLSTRVLLRHAANAALSSATYVDGRRGVLRSLLPGAPERALPTDVTLAELLLLRGWESGPLADDLCHSEPPLPPPGLPERAEILLNLASALISRRPADAEILCDVALMSRVTSRRDHLAVLLRRGSRVTGLCVAWSSNGGEVVRAAWPRLLTVADALGDYARLIVVTRLSEEARRRVERQLQRRSAGATPVRVLGAEEFPVEPDRQADLIWSM